MSGLDAIVKTIGEQAGAEARALLDAARADADRTLDEARSRAELERAQILDKARMECKDILARAQAQAEMDRRHALLAAKQEMLSRVVEEAREALSVLPEERYFPLLIRLAAANAVAGEGTMRLSARDLMRLPRGFSEQLAAALPRGASLTIAREPAPIADGFILQYGDIEQNCSFAALFDERREQIRDEARSALF